MAPDIWLISGLPGSSKTATARALTQSLSKSAYIEGDKISLMVVGGRKFPPEVGLPNDALAQLDLSYQNQALLAASFYDHGCKAVIDFFIYDLAGLAQYQHSLRVRPLHFIMLDPNQATILRRDTSRGTEHARLWLPLYGSLVRELSQVGYWIDNSSLTIEETVTSILENKAKALVTDGLE